MNKKENDEVDEGVNKLISNKNKLVSKRKD